MKYVLWGFPLAVIAAQLLPAEISLIVGIATTALGLSKRFRMVLLIGFVFIGHLTWELISEYINSSVPDGALQVVMGRFGLIGYIVLFTVWNRFQPSGINYFRFGNLKEQLKFPLIWWGFKEYIWRFILI